MPLQPALREETDMSATVSPITLRAMTASARDLESALRLSRAVGWAYQLEDWRIAQGLGQGVLAEEGGAVIASALCWPFGEAFATCGSIIVSPSMQGRGLGRALLTRLLALTGERAVMLNSTNEGMRLYQSFGFEALGRVHQHLAPASLKPAPGEADPQLRPACAGDLQAILQLDRRATGADRHRMIEAFIRIGSVAVIEREGQPQAYAICRPFGLGQVIGPVVARNTEDAKSLIRHFLQARAGQILRIDIPGDTGLGGWLTAQGLPEVDQVTMMMRGKRPPICGPERLFALASQSFG
jgi:GNAT superfamily N-acetyltransferase